MDYSEESKDHPKVLYQIWPFTSSPKRIQKLGLEVYNHNPITWYILAGGSEVQCRP